MDNKSIMDIKSIIETLPLSDHNDPRYEDGDYFDQNDLLICGKCGTNKQIRIANRFGEMLVPANCMCKSEEIRAAKAEIDSFRMKDAIEHNRKKGIPEQYRNATFASDNGDNPPLTDKAKEYVSRFDPKSGVGLLLYGPPSRGKSYAAAMAANALIDKGYKVYMTNIERLNNIIASLREKKQDFIDGLRTYDLIIIDDFGAERDTTSMYGFSHNVFETLKGKNLIVTTNMDEHFLKNPTGADARIIERIWEACEPYEVKGANQRLNKMLEMKRANG